MNIVNDTEAIKKCQAYFKWWPKWARSEHQQPIFVLYDEQLPKNYSPEPSLWAELWDGIYNLRLPFNVIRIYCPKEKELDKVHWHIVRSTGGFIEIVSIQIGEKGEETYASYRKMYVVGAKLKNADGSSQFVPNEAVLRHNSQKYIDGLRVAFDQKTDNDKMGAFAYSMAEYYLGALDRQENYMTALDRHPGERANKLRRAFEEETSLHTSFVVHFAYQVAYPSHHIVEVIPNKQGKSVEWLKARTHFVLLPTNVIQESQRPGGISKKEQSELLMRCAHERRGHVRHLRADRYAKGPDGQVRQKNPAGFYATVWIKDTWVGPKEWKSQDAQTIYKIRDLSAKQDA